MSVRWISPNDEWAVPVIGYVLVFAAAAASVFLVLYWLLQPVKAVNLGLAAYRPPPDTILEPPARKLDAPELVEPSPLHALAREPTAEPAVAPPAPQQQEVRRPVRKRTQERRETREDNWGFSWNGGFGQNDRYRQEDRYRRNERSRSNDTYRSWW
jgi:hypothetical protein